MALVVITYVQLQYIILKIYLLVYIHIYIYILSLLPILDVLIYNTGILTVPTSEVTYTTAVLLLAINKIRR